MDLIRIFIPNADLDPGDQLNADPCGSGPGSETLFWTNAAKNQGKIFYEKHDFQHEMLSF
jgi:hypothetical protein